MEAEAIILEEKASAGITVVNGRDYVTNADGGLTPLDLVKVEDFLEDQMVRKIIGFARPLSAELARFKKHTRADIAEFDRMLEVKYGLVKRGRAGAGNQKYRSLDGLMMVETRVNKLIEFGPQLQVAKGLVDECLNEWTDDGRAEVRGLITRAFKVDKAGQISKDAIFELFKVESNDPRWLQAMEAISAAVRVIGSKEYLHFSFREDREADWIRISLNIADA
ncbi:MAG: sulfate transporter [Stutzerimonas stutzeri]|nr:MAG: sulfate transporter [Stutzerimonas stutzeri]